MDMKKFVLAAAMAGAFSASAFATDADSRYLTGGNATSQTRDVATEPFAAPPSKPVGCDQAAGGAAKLDACSPIGSAGGSNSGSRTR
jgi:opacity protein-like surface antigen